MEDAIQSLVSSSSERRQALIMEQLRKDEVDVSQKDPDLAFLLEFAATALFGTMGIGYLYSGMGIFGLTRLVAYWLAIIFFFVFFSICWPLICLAVPLLGLHVFAAYVSANDLKSTLRRAQEEGFSSASGAAWSSGVAPDRPVIDTPGLDPLGAFERELAASRAADPLANIPTVYEDELSTDPERSTADLEIDPNEEAEAEAETIAEVFEEPGRPTYASVEDGDRDSGLDVEEARHRLEAADAEQAARREIDPTQARASADEPIIEAFDEPSGSPLATAQDGDRDSGIDVDEMRARLEEADAESRGNAAQGSDESTNRDEG